MEYIEAKIGGHSVTIIQAADIAKIDTDAIIIPQFQEGVATGSDGVAMALARSGAVSGMQEFQGIVKGARFGSLDFGTAHVTNSGGGAASKLIHVVSVGATRETAFGVIHDCLADAIKQARQHGISNICSPALSTGSEGSLSNRQSAQAMLLALHEDSQAGCSPISITIVIQKPDMYRDFTAVLKDGSYNSANIAQVGEREFDAKAFMRRMQAMVGRDLARLMNLSGT